MIIFPNIYCTYYVPGNVLCTRVADKISALTELTFQWVRRTINNNWKWWFLTVGKCYAENKTGWFNWAKVGWRRMRGWICLDWVFWQVLTAEVKFKWSGRRQLFEDLGSKQFKINKICKGGEGHFIEYLLGVQFSQHHLFLPYIFLYPYLSTPEECW